VEMNIDKSPSVVMQRELTPPASASVRCGVGLRRPIAGHAPFRTTGEACRLQLPLQGRSDDAESVRMSPA